ncbi:MAG: AarF/UbiB family protein [Chloroflexota bacterium]|nr:AarF/UbiB family protein [Chloroflexota bacterium]
MRIGNITLSPVAFYSPAVWDISISYRVFLVTWRLVELMFISIRFLFIRAPFLLVWTRLPLTRGITIGRYKTLQGILGPQRDVKLSVAGGRTGTMPFIDSYKSPEDIRKEQEFLRSIVKPPSGIKVIIGGIMRGLITELGSIFIKLSQIMSMRPELPPFMREELALVQDRLPGLSENEVRTILERELMKPIDQVFEWVDYQAVAAASLAVVHHGKLRDGREVALKIQRPFLQGTVALDSLIILKILIGAARLLLPQIRKTDLTFFTLSFESAIEREIDFDLEGHVQEKCRAALEESAQTRQCMVIAKVYLEYTTKKLLTMEFIHDFVRVDEIFDKLTPDEIWEFVTMKIPGFPDVPATPVVIGCRFPMQLAWQGEVFHGDLHLGNIYVKKPASAEDTWRLFLCDFGMYEDIPREQWSSVVFLLWGILGGQPDMAVDGMKALHVQQGGRLSEVDWVRLGMAFTNFSRSWIEEAPEEESGIVIRRSHLHEGGLTRQLLALLFGQVIASGLRLPYWIWLVLKSYLYLEESGTSIMGGSYDWYGWIFDQYSIRMEKDAVLALFDRTNIFTIDKHLEHLQFPLSRGRDSEYVTQGLLELLNELDQDRAAASGHRWEGR